MLFLFEFRNGKKYSAEVHFVHQNPQTSQLAVLGFFIQSKRNISTVNNEWNKYLTMAAELGMKDDSDILSLNLVSFIGNNLHDFWRYEGSLTVPPCSEGIIWSIFKQTIVLNETLIDLLRQNVLVTNRRDPQPLYNRLVYRSFLMKLYHRFTISRFTISHGFITRWGQPLIG